MVKMSVLLLLWGGRWEAVFMVVLVEVLCYSGEKNKECIAANNGPKGNADNCRRGSDESCNRVPHQHLLV